MIKRESKFSILFRHWIMANPHVLPRACSIEMKQTTTDSIPYSSLGESQINYASAISESSKGVLVRVLGGGGEPDYIWLRRQPAYIAVKFPTFFCVISIAVWQNQKVPDKKRKSLTAERARQIAEYVVDL